MGKLCILYDILKRQNKEIIYLFKSGIFFIALNEDASFLSNTFNLKLTELNKTTKKCGFPISSIKKYTDLFNKNNIKFKIIDSKNDVNYTPNDYIVNNDINELLNTILSANIDNFSISESYKFIEKIQLKCKKIKENLQ